MTVEGMGNDPCTMNTHTVQGKAGAGWMLAQQDMSARTMTVLSLSSAFSASLLLFMASICSCASVLSWSASE